ncbi:MULTISPECIES: COG3650 family protein [unclassified Sphingomonas]|uniref:COG3650 family protein n=1 Tax=unclassified Sphingomonas TaxID=196159 RepID=UPI0006F3E6D3|nr:MULTISPECIES: hypothetical protein [unclassified Sphingomonas]KQM56936.1 hypothetical protein ASE65_13810 [Sphingomonas sp. Leaf16]KQN09307.1 hypothetical protein ASE81_13855 [Sphingomonas sp. Leaf29]KQN17486.1 hypothetical protein ASE83_13790 [Sphingomonas sp. Leaf32]
MTRRTDRSMLLLGLLLAGCGGGGEPVAENAVAPIPTPKPVATRVAPPATPAATGSVPERLTVTTNEPFYTVRIAGDSLLLSGVDLPERRFPVTDRRTAADAREWEAQADGRTLRVRVVRAPCKDDMSGAPRDFSATLTVDGRTVRGCGFVGTPAPPPGEERAAPPDTIPMQFVGRWNRDAAACTRPAALIEGVRVTPNELWFHESVGAVKRVEPLSAGRFRITADYDGEGQRWTATQTLRVDGDRLTIVTDGQPFSRIRCP